MDNQSDTYTKEHVEIEDTLENNVDIMRDRMNNVNNRIDKAITELTNQKHEWIKDELTRKISVLEAKCSKDENEIKQLKNGNVLLDKIINEKKTVISSLELSIKHWLRRYEQVQIENADLSDQCSFLEESNSKAAGELQERQKEIAALQEEISILKTKLESIEHKKRESSNIPQDNFLNVICAMSQVIGTINKELLQEKMVKEQCIRSLETKEVEVKCLAQRLEAVTRELEEKDKEALKVAQMVDQFTVVSNKMPLNISDSGARDVNHDADNTSDYTQSSTENSKMVSDLQKIIQFNNSTITTLQSDVIYKESLMAELKNKLQNMTRELQTFKIKHEVKKSPSLGKLCFIALGLAIA